MGEDVISNVCNWIRDLRLTAQRLAKKGSVAEALALSLSGGVVGMRGDIGSHLILGRDVVVSDTGGVILSADADAGTKGHQLPPFFLPNSSLLGYLLECAVAAAVGVDGDVVVLKQHRQVFRRVMEEYGLAETPSELLPRKELAGEAACAKIGRRAWVTVLHYAYLQNHLSAMETAAVSVLMLHSVSEAKASYSLLQSERWRGKRGATAELEAAVSTLMKRVGDSRTDAHRLPWSSLATVAPRSLAGDR